MIGNLTIDKASMNISYFLYSIKLIFDNGGKISRRDFIIKMASFIGLPPTTDDGKENRTPYNKSKLPRYFGFIDVIKDENKKDVLVLTNRGKKVVPYIEENIDELSDKKYGIKENYKNSFVDLIFESVVFDTFGKNNCGAEQSNTDVEPPKALFKMLLDLGESTAEEFCYLIFGLNNLAFKTYDEAKNKILYNRKIGKHDYKTELEAWNVYNLSRDCKLINIFTNDNIGLIKVRRNEEINKNVYSLDEKLDKNHLEQIENVQVINSPLRLFAYFNSETISKKKWVSESVLGRVASDDLLIQYFENSNKPFSEASNNSKITVLEQLLQKAYLNPNKNVYLVAYISDERTILKMFGKYENLLRFNIDLSDTLSGWSDSISDTTLYNSIKAINSKIFSNLNFGEIRLPSNVQIIGIITMGKLEEQGVADYKFKRAVVDPADEIDFSGETKYVIQEGKKTYTKAELEAIFKAELEKYSTNKWIGVMYLGVKFGHIVSGQDAKEILDAIGMKSTAITEYAKGKSLAESVVAKDSLVVVPGSSPAPIEELDVRQLILDRYHARTDFDIVTIRQKYSKFKSLYSKEAISALNGLNLLKRLFAPKDMDENSLIYNLEHNSYYGEFGGIGGGSQFKYPLYYYSKKQKWCSGGSLKNQVEYTEEEAIERTEDIRNKLVALFNLVESTDLTHIENFALIQNLMNSDSLYRKIWVFKYLHMLYPEVFSTFYSWNWLSKVVKFLQLPEGSLLIMNGEISSFAKELRIPNVFLAQIIYELLPSVDEDETDEESEEEESEEAMIELPERNPRTYKQYPLNLILYGAPGTGKTYSTMELACSIFDRGTASIDDICEGNTHSNREEVMEHYNDLVKQGFITFTTFHQSYGYEDFIQGLRPDDKSDTLKFVPVDGVFKKIVNKAIKDQTNNYVIIIDEINRANISKVLGELITLLETDKRWGEINQLSTKLPSGQPFAVPNNLYVIGTMNSADKSISLIDAALRRRFEFVEVSVNYKTITNSIARSVLKKINEKLEGQLDSSDLLVGHAYFIGKDENSICDVLNHNVTPLLYEYFFDSKAKVKDILKYALDGLNYEIEDEPGKRLRAVKKAE